jgi:hypothetical protein
MTARLTIRYQRSATVLFHRCSKTVPDRSTCLKPRCSWGGRKMPYAPRATEESSSIQGTI